MLRRFIFSSAVALLAAVIPAALSAQATDLVRGVGRSSSGRVTVGGSFGGLSGAANLNDAGTADWRLGWVASVDATAWLSNNLGVRATGGWAQDSLRGAALTGRGKFNKFTYDADVVLRYPLQAGSATVAPYVLGGLGAITSSPHPRRAAANVHVATTIAANGVDLIVPAPSRRANSHVP